MLKPRLMTLLCLPDELLHNIYIYLLSPPPQTAILSPHTLPYAEDAFQLSATCTRLRRIFRASVTSLDMPWDSPVYPHTLANLFGSTLRQVSIHFHARADVFLDKLALHSNNLRSLSLSNCTVPEDALKNVVRHTYLDTLILDFVFINDPDSLLISISPYMNKLQTLHLHGMSKLSSKGLLAILGASGRSLQQLSLNYLRHPTITSPTILSIYDHAPRLSSLSLVSLRYDATASSIANLCALYGKQLNCLTLCSTRMSEAQFSDLLHLCPNIAELKIEESWSGRHISTVVDAVDRINPQLRILHIRGLRGLTDADVRQFMTVPTNLSLRRQILLTDTSLYHISDAGRHLRTLDLRGCLFTDFGLSALAKCSALNELQLGSDGETITRRAAEELGSNAVTNNGIERMLRGCGRELCKFVWESHRVRRTRQTTMGLATQTVGVADLTSRGILDAISRFCKKIHTVELDGLEPYRRTRREWARLELDAYELEERVGRVIIKVNKTLLT